MTQTVSLLIFWMFPFLQPGGAEQSLAPGEASRPGLHVSLTTIERTTDLPFSGDPGRRRLDASLWDEDEEEDSSEDGSLHAVLPPPSGLVAFGRVAGVPLVLARPGSPRFPSHTTPLRC
jgi:hypothetical protein